MIDVPEGFKRCAKGEQCVHPLGCIQPATEEYFYKDKRMPDGYKKRCRECCKRTARVHYYSNIEAELTRSRAKYAKNPSLQLARTRNWRNANPDKAKASQRNWIEQNRGKIRSNARRSNYKRRTRKKGLPHSLTELDWLRALDYFEHCCAYCLDPPQVGQTLHADHFIPLASRKCPGTVPENIVPACRHCNSSKGRKHPKRWLTERFSPFYALIALRRIRDYFEWLKSQDEGAP